MLGLPFTYPPQLEIAPISLSSDAKRNQHPITPFSSLSLSLLLLLDLISLYVCLRSPLTLSVSSNYYLVSFQADCSAHQRRKSEGKMKTRGIWAWLPTPLLLWLLLSFWPRGALGEIKTLRIKSDARPMILFEKFGFSHSGHVKVSVWDVSYTKSPTSPTPPSPSLLGFFLLSQESLLQVLQESQTNPNWCVLSSHYVLPLFTFQDLPQTPTTSYNHSFPISFPISSPNDYSLFFANCAAGSSVSMHVRTEMYNVIRPSNAKDYLPVGLSQLPLIYLSFFLVYAAFLAVWLSVCLRNRPSVHRIHLLMGLLLLVKALNLLSAAEDYHYTKITGTPHGWDYLFYAFQLARVVLLFTVIVLIGTGWSFLRPFLQDREKKVLALVIPLQVLVNIASVVIGENGPFLRNWVTWNQLFLIVDVLCCCAVIFPVVWSIRSLRETSKTDGKAARNLAKLTLFRHFYVLVVGYLYFTRIVVYALRTIAHYQYQWVSFAAEEAASLTFYLLVFHMFRPADRNRYFSLDYDEEEAAQVALRDDDFEL